MAATEEQVYIGQAVPRREDAARITGQGTYVDNYTAPGLPSSSSRGASSPTRGSRASTSRRPARPPESSRRS